MFSLSASLGFYYDLPAEGRESWLEILALLDADVHAELVRHLVGLVMDGKVVSHIRPRHPHG